MKRLLKYVFQAILFLVFAVSCPHCETSVLDDIVGEYSSATEIQRPQIEGQYRYKRMSVTGTVKDVLGWNTFDRRTDKGGLYYKVVTVPEVTKAGVIYDMHIFFKSKDRVKELDKGRRKELDVTLLKIVDNIGSFSVWVFADELTAEDKAMLEL